MLPLHYHRFFFRALQYFLLKRGYKALECFFWIHHRPLLYWNASILHIILRLEQREVDFLLIIRACFPRLRRCFVIMLPELPTFFLPIQTRVPAITSGPKHSPRCRVAQRLIEIPIALT